MDIHRRKHRSLPTGAPSWRLVCLDGAQSRDEESEKECESGDDNAPHAAARKQSLKLDQQTMVPMLNAPRIGSREVVLTIGDYGALDDRAMRVAVEVVYHHDFFVLGQRFV